jgi:hypothetical protein
VSTACCELDLQTQLRGIFCFRVLNTKDGNLLRTQGAGKRSAILLRKTQHLLNKTGAAAFPLMALKYFDFPFPLARKRLANPRR